MWLTFSQLKRILKEREKKKTMYHDTYINVDNKTIIATVVHVNKSKESNDFTYLILGITNETNMRAKWTVKFLYSHQ